MKEFADKSFTILVIGERDLHETVRRCLPEGEAIELCCCNEEEKAQTYLAKQAPDMIVADFDLPRFKAIRFLGGLFHAGERREVVMVAEAPAIETVVRCMQLGARDFLQLPKETTKLHEIVKRVYAQWQQNQKGAVFQAQQHERFSVSGIIGASPQMQHVILLIQKITGRRWVTVLIRGETGTGKEVVARAIHYGSSEAAKNAPFVEINCTAIPENLLEAELFGYEKGAFTDAKFSKKGLFELAEGGTLFLDEIGDMSLVLQAKLLKAIEEKRFRRLGGTHSIEVKTRIMAGTHADMERSIEAGRFRRDLYYRLNVINIMLPPLRERGKDVLLLAHHFVNHYAAEYSATAKKIAPAAEEALMSYDWPGNVRELQHVVERAVLLGDNLVIDVKEIYEALGLEPKPRVVTTAAGGESARPHWSRVIEIPPEGLSLKQGECRLIEETLRLTKWNKTRASQILGISRPRLSRKIEEYKIADQRPHAHAYVEA
ncbi:sigma-54-dependent Fis family transcriptional regulator [candidate division KSB1 bacterium]|nr:sigma-54-dependent Fis family transcriptional regulator [candidate division KSB1 bacterium]